MVSVLLTVKTWRERDKGSKMIYWKILEHFYKLKEGNQLRKEVKYSR